MSIRFADLFCGAGGSSTGLVEAGFELVAAANHTKIAIATHAANHPGAEHLCVDISTYDMRHLPRADVLWASPICTEISPAGGRARSKRGLGQGPLPMEEFGAIEPGAWERTRATAWDVLRAAETWRYKAILVENVPEFATDWDLFEVWLSALDRLGYDIQVVSLNSAHLAGPGNKAAPQWRDRIYIVATRKGMRRPDLAPRPAAWCPRCSAEVAAVQTWRGSRRIGKYGRQYDYRCPSSGCRTIVEPVTRPAAEIIDWSDIGRRIGDRKRTDRRPEGLAPATIAKVRRGLEQFQHSGEPFMVELRRNGGARSLTEPIAAVTAGGNHHAWVLNYRKGARATGATEPLRAVSTVDSAALVVSERASLDIADCHLRMISAREQMLAQRFPDDYVVHGTRGEQTMQAGNAVSVNAARWIGHRVASVL
jgi:DNA (cytosine-5)-methyltransferase 1